MSVDEYLDSEQLSNAKREFVSGFVFPLPEASVDHCRIATNTTCILGIHLRGQRCEVFNSDMKVRVPGSSTGPTFYYPDASVVCEPNSGRDAFNDKPVVVVEVISESTRRVDEIEKRQAYLSLDSCKVYVLLESRSDEAVVVRRTDDGVEQEEYSGIDAVIPLPEIGCSLSLADCYAGVHFE